jgi:hypothetical protein
MTYTEAEAVVREYLNDYVPEDAFMARTEALAALDEMRREYERDLTWDDWMAWLDAKYPASVFTGESGDEGPRTVVLGRRLADTERRLAEAERALDRLNVEVRSWTPASMLQVNAVRILDAYLASRDQEDQG